MFKLPAREESFPTPCKINTPVGESTETREIVVHFRVVASSRWDELVNRGAGALFEEIIADWEHVYASDGKTPFAVAAARTSSLAAEHPLLFRRRDHGIPREVLTPKKLQGAARRLTGPREALTDDAQILGVDLPGSRIAAGCDYPVLPENRDAVRLCCAVQSQWKIHGFSGRRTGLDYAGCAAAAEGMGIAWAETFDKLRVMEAAMLAEWRATDCQRRRQQRQSSKPVTRLTTMLATTQPKHSGQREQHQHARQESGPGEPCHEQRHRAFPAAPRKASRQYTCRLSRSGRWAVSLTGNPYS